MSQIQTGSCPKCGAPIYAETPWWAITPPPPIYTCNCTAHLRQVITSNSVIVGEVLKGEKE